ncbi:MAG: ferrochelatase [Actinomycetota bacterium]
MKDIDSVLFIGFGAPKDTRNIMAFLRLVVRGRNIPRERLEAVAHHYELIGGSPYNELTFKQVVALKRKLRDEYGVRLPVYAGMRNWRPFMPRVIRCMNKAGRHRAVGIILAAHRTNTSLQRYRLDVSRAIAQNRGVGPEMVYLRPWFDDPLFLEANASRIEEATGYRRGMWPRDVPIVFTAHSIPTRMAEGSPYIDDLMASCRGVAGILGVADWSLAYQSRSGDGRVPWLEPDISDVLRELHGRGVAEVVVQPIGFLHDHVEVLFDLDVEARETAAELGLRFHRAGTVGDHPAFIEMLARRVLAAARGDESVIDCVVAPGAECEPADAQRPAGAGQRGNGDRSL